MKKRKVIKRRGRSRGYEERSSKPDLPPTDFLTWWNPTGTDEESGAHKGGHPDAQRLWARKDPGRWTRRTYGVNANHAWLAAPYRNEYLAWVQAGKPARAEEFVSLALPTEEQRARWAHVAALVSLGDIFEGSKL